MEYIDKLQSEAIPEPIVETVKPKMHPLLEAMNSLKEEGIVGSVGPDTIFNQVKDIHREFRDIEEGDLPDRIYWFDEYKTTQLPLSQINLDEFIVDEDLVEDYIDYIKDSPKTMPPIVYDPIAKSVIDGMHRANAYARLGYETIPAYVGLTKSDSYGESDTYDIAETSSTGQGGGSAGVGGAQMVGGPTTYEEEYGMFKSKGPRRITAMTNEALDSSYEYFRSRNALDNEFKFVTEDGISYSVVFSGKDLVEVAFSAILPGEENNFRPNKTTLTGTGNSRKVFGTVIKIVQEFVEEHKPKTLYFTASKDEPSRVRLYNTMISQIDKALPDYTSSGNVDMGEGVAFLLKRKIDNVNEALDSSYEYRTSEYAPGQVFYFNTDDGSVYRVQFGRADKAAEVAFERLGKDNEYKIGLTGTGDSRKIFGTVINIVKDYLAKNNPKLLLFTANNSEPSRVKLYKMLASKVDQALPDYTFAGALNNGTFTQFNINHKSNPKISKLDKVKAAGWKTLDKIVGESAAETTSLDKIYHGMRPDHDEMIWNYVGDSDFDTEFPIETINPTKLGLYLKSQYRIEDLEELFDMMDEDQEILVNHYMKEPNLSNEIIVMYDGKVVDGNHRALAAALTNKPIRYIDIGEEDESS